MEELDNLDIFVRDAPSSWKKLDAIDVKILEGITALGPRNLVQVSDSIDLPHTTVRFRINRLMETSNLFLHLIPNITNLGLKRAVVFVESVLGYESELIDFLKINDYWVFMCSIYGKKEGSMGIWNVPFLKIDVFNEFLNSLIESGIARSVECFWTTPYHSISVSGRWFNPEDKIWMFDWDEWIIDLESGKGEYPNILNDPKYPPMKIDESDLLIISELEDNALLTIPEVSKLLKMPVSKAKYHFHNHIQKRDLIAGYQVEVYRYPFPLCEIAFFKFEFCNHEHLRKFVISLLDKPIAINIAKVLGENSLIIHVFLPRRELRRFIRVLSDLIKSGFLTSYYYYFQDMHQTWRETIPFEHFIDGEWQYNIREQLEKIGHLSKKFIK